MKVRLYTLKQFFIVLKVKYVLFYKSELFGNYLTKIFFIQDMHDISITIKKDKKQLNCINGTTNPQAQDSTLQTISEANQMEQTQEKKLRHRYLNFIKHFSHDYNMSKKSMILVFYDIFDRELNQNNLNLFLINPPPQ